MRIVRKARDDEAIGRQRFRVVQPLDMETTDIGASVFWPSEISETVLC
jgi:hypothetical protein